MLRKPHQSYNFLRPILWKDIANGDRYENNQIRYCFTYKCDNDIILNDLITGKNTIILERFNPQNNEVKVFINRITGECIVDKITKSGSIRWNLVYYKNGTCRFQMHEKPIVWSVGAIIKFKTPYCHIYQSFNDGVLIKNE